MITITLPNKETLEVEKGLTLNEIGKIYKEKYKVNVVGAEINNEVVPMETIISKNTTINFIDRNNINGYRIYKAGICFVLEVALKEAFNKKYEVTYNHSIANGLHLTIDGEGNFTLNDAKKLKKEMNELIQNDERIYYLNVEK